MTFHIISKCPISVDAAEYLVSRESDRVNIEHAATGKTISVSLSEVAEFKGGAVVHWSPVYGFLTSSADHLINDKDLDSYLSYARNVDRNVAAIVLNEQGTEAAAVFYGVIDCDGEVILSEKNCATAAAIEQVFPGVYASRMRFRNAKVELLRKVGSHDSLSALEKQVDLLTSLVVQLAQHVPAESRPALASKLQQLVTSTGSNQGKTDDEVIEKVASFKSLMRSYQAEYFAQRDGIA